MTSFIHTPHTAVESTLSHLCLWKAVEGSSLLSQCGRSWTPSLWHVGALGPFPHRLPSRLADPQNCAAGPTVRAAPATQFPGGGCCWSWDARATFPNSPPASGFPGIAGSAAMAGRCGSRALPLLFPCFPLLHVLVHPPLGVQMCGSLQHPGVWGRETFVRGRTLDITGPTATRSQPETPGGHVQTALTPVLPKSRHLIQAGSLWT